MMKFFKFVSCCGVGAGDSKEVAAAAVRRRAEETTAFVAGASRNVFRKRGRGRGGPEWKPTLGSISEDNVPVDAAAQRAVKRKSGGDNGGRRDSRNIADISKHDEDYDYRRGRYNGVFPALAPTLFMM